MSVDDLPTFQYPFDDYEERMEEDEDAKRIIRRLIDSIDNSFEIDVITCNYTFSFSYQKDIKKYFKGVGLKWPDWDGPDKIEYKKKTLLKLVDKLTCIEKIELDGDYNNPVFMSDYRIIADSNSIDQLQNIKTFDDYIQYNLEFLDGLHPFTPTHNGRIDPETIPLLNDIKKINKLGFLTTNSQNGIDVCEGIDESRLDGSYTSFIVGLYPKKKLQELFDLLTIKMKGKIHMKDLGDNDFRGFYVLPNIEKLLKKSYTTVWFNDTVPCREILHKKLVLVLKEISNETADLKETKTKTTKDKVREVKTKKEASVCLQHDKNGKELYYDVSSGKKVRIAKDKVGDRKVTTC